jgi:hypothetical protein
MAQLAFYKLPGGHFAPADEASERFTMRIRVGEGFTSEVKRARNIKFHRKLFALLQLAFDIWTPPALDYRGVAVTRDFEAFRESVLIMAGFYEANYGVDGAVSLRAKSISFEKLDEDGFAELYPKVFDVIWDKVLGQAGYESREQLESVVMRVLDFQ